MTAFKGVRSSWLMLAKNELLTRLAIASPAGAIRANSGNIGVFQACLALGDRVHLLDALLAGPDQEGVFEQNPGGVLQPAPFIDDLDAVNGLRKKDAAQEMIGGDDG